MPNLDRYSISAVPIVCKTAKGLELGRATCFFHEHNGDTYLVSNWHVLSGRDPRSGQPRHGSGATPSILDFPIMRRGQLGQWIGAHIGLLNEQGENAWLQHAELGQGVDIAVLKLPPAPDGGELFPLNTADQVADMVVPIGSDVFILGFPLGQTKQAALPIWKRGSIASEPDIPLDEGHRCFLVDTATREGMSGSPVIARKDGGYQSANGGQIMGGGSFTRFLGVYSGRYVGDDLEEMQLGVVWHADLLQEIIENGVAGDYVLR